MGSSRKTVWPLLAAIAIAGGSYFGSAQLHDRGGVAVAAAQDQTARPTPEPRGDVVAPATDLSRAFRTVHTALKDAVVNINVTKKPTGGAAMGRRGAIPPQFRDMLPPGAIPDDQDSVVRGTGSGVIVNAEGYILTNNHVVSDASEITVRLNDGRELKANLVGTDPKTDLAVVRVKANGLTFAKFGDSEALDVGDWVLAFGSPFGFSQTMTQGIISAKGRHVPIIAAHNPALQGLTYENFLQTDAAINPGNSGGPLVNLKGEVVGINAAIASETGQYNGIGFSIPSNDAQYIMKSLIQNGKVVRGFLGVIIEDLNHPDPADQGLVDAIRREGFKGENGILIKEVTVAGPAAKSGLQAGDVITTVNGKPVISVDELRNQIARTTPDSKIDLGIFRGGKSQQVAAAVGTQPDTNRPTGLAAGRGDRPAAVESDDLGISVQDLPARLAERYGLKPQQGAVVSEVDPSGVAGSAGLKSGDVITRLNSQDISSAKQLNDALNSAKLSDGVRLRVRTDDGRDRLLYLEKK